MHRAAKILSVASLPRILLREDNGKLRWIELECLTVDPNAYLYLRTFLDKQVDLVSEKNSEKGRIIESGKDLGAELLNYGFAKISSTEESKTYAPEDLQSLREAATKEPKVYSWPASATTEEETSSYISSLDFVKRELVKVDSNSCVQVSLKNLQLLLENVEAEQLAEFVAGFLVNIKLSQSTYYDTFRNIDTIELTLPIQVEKELLKRGWATLKQQAQIDLDSPHFAELYEASVIAKKGLLGIWKSYFDSFLEKLYDPPTEAKVVKVLEGHRYVLRRKEETLIVELSRVSCPSHKENGAYQCRELARKQLVGRRFSVLLQKTKLSAGEHRAILVRKDDQVLVDKLMIENGLATVRISTNYRSDPHREMFVQLDKRNREEKVGIYTNELNIFRLEDLTRLENKIEKASAREFADRVLTHEPVSIPSVVQGFKDSAKVIVRMPFYRAALVVRLDGVKTLSVNSKDKSIELFKTKSFQFCEDNYLQKDVEVLLSSFSEEQGFSGSIYFNKKNIVEELLFEGLVRIADHKLPSRLFQLEEKAREQQKGTWAVELLEHFSEKCKEKAYSEIKQATISHIDKGSILYYQHKEDLDTIDDIAAELEGTLAKLVVGKTYSLVYYAAPFEGAYYRAVVNEKFVHRNDAVVNVDFIDYGNSAIVKTSELRELPSKPIVQNNKGFAHRIDLAFVESITSGNEMSDNALEAINGQLVGQTFFIERRVFESESPRRTYEIAVLYDSEKERHPFISKNFSLVAEGLLKIDENQLQFLSSEQQCRHLLQLEQEARKKGLFIWYDNNEDEFDRDQCSKMKGFNSFMNSNY